MNTDKEFVPYEQALALKELGFDKPCFGYWRNENLPNPITIGQYTTKEDMEYEISGQDEYHNFENIIALAPLYQQAFRWFREKHNLHAEPYTADMGVIEYCFQIRDLYSERYIYDNFVGAGSSYMGTFNTPEEAELACLNKLIEIVKNK